MMVTGSALAAVHKDLIITLAARNKLPAVYFERQFCHCWRPDVLWAQHHRPMPACASSRARSRPTYRCKRRPSTNASSISELRKSSGLSYHPHCSRVQALYTYLAAPAWGRLWHPRATPQQITSMAGIEEQETDDWPRSPIGTRPH